MGIENEKTIFRKENKELSITLPYPPSINNYYYRQMRGVFLRPEIKTYRKEVWAALFNKPKFGKSKVHLEVKLFPPSNRIMDIDNPIKALLDAIQHAGTIDDDSQIKKLTVEKLDVKKGGEIEIIIKEIK